MPQRDHYTILGVPADANAGTIKNAYRRLALKLHPDAGTEPDPARFREVHHAYRDILSDGKPRAGDPLTLKLAAFQARGSQWKKSAPGCRSAFPMISATSRLLSANYSITSRRTSLASIARAAVPTAGLDWSWC